MERIPVSGPWITQKEIDYVADAAGNAWYANANCYHERFEKAFAKYLNVRFAMALPSCTSAIHLSLAARGIGPGDEVIVPEATWIASAAPVTYVGATTVFADIDPVNWCLSAESFAACITPRTKAVIPVDLYGNVPDWDALRAIADQHGIFVIEDAAEAVGSEYRGRRAGSLGDTGVFSFHGSKTLTTGEGGLLATNDEALFKRALFLRDHGRTPGDRMFFNTEVAFKYKMSSLQAALGLAQLERVEELIARKRDIFSWYHAELAGLPGVTLNPEPPVTRNSYWMVTIILDPSYRLPKAELMEMLALEQIDTRPFFHPLSSIPAYRDSPQAQRAHARNKIARELCVSGLNLPSALNLTEAKVKRVCDALKRILESGSSAVEHRAHGVLPGQGHDFPDTAMSAEPSDMFVTTVIPVYNAEPFIQETLDSVAGQTRRPDRLVVLDNCSTDRTPEIVRSFAAAHPEMSCEWRRNETNVGGIGNFNRALEFSKETDGLHLLSADDLIEPGFFERVLPALQGVRGFGLAYCALRFIDEHGKLIPPYPTGGGGAERELSLKEFLSNQAELRHVYCQSVVLKTNRQPPIARFPTDWQQATDVVFFADWGRHSERIVSIPEPLCSFRIHTGSGTGQNVAKLDAWVMEEWRAMRTIAAWIPEGRFAAWLREHKQRCIFAARSKVKMQQLTATNPEYARQIQEATHDVTGPLHLMLGAVAVKARDLWQKRFPQRIPQTDTVGHDQ